MSAQGGHTTVHLLRHGEVYNPEGILYGRLPGYVLSEPGRRMAERVAESLAARDVRHVVASPLERAQETAAPVATSFGLEVHTDERLIEAANVFEGLTFGVGEGSLRRPGMWRHLRNPRRPSWGEPYVEQVARMLTAAARARDAARGAGDGGGEAVCVSHQLPIWATRLSVEGKPLWHDPRRRQCSLASLTSLTYEEDDRIVSLTYAEPARDLLPASPKRRLQAGA
ncbi:MAG: histidine phosphatase family protein [Actinomycetota bacterium]|nr:histidine phosphatase family protein [Actinomycetota bacterium]